MASTSPNADRFICAVVTSPAPKAMAHIPAAWRYASYRCEARRSLDRGDMPAYARLMDVARMTRARASAWERRCIGAITRTLLGRADITDPTTLCEAAGIWWHEAMQPNPVPAGWAVVEG